MVALLLAAAAILQSAETCDGSCHADKVCAAVVAECACGVATPCSCAAIHVGTVVVRANANETKDLSTGRWDATMPREVAIRLRKNRDKDATHSVVVSDPMHVRGLVGESRRFVGADDKDTFGVTLTFDSMHCEECQAEVEATLRRMQGFTSSTVSDATVTVTFDDTAPVPSFGSLPKDLTLKSATVRIRGTVGFPDPDHATLAAKGSGASLTLVNPEKPAKRDELAKLRAKLGGKNRFWVAGTLSGKTVVLEGFEATDWEDR
jgi:hypothetical protein